MVAWCRREKNLSRGSRKEWRRRCRSALFKTRGPSRDRLAQLDQPMAPDRGPAFGMFGSCWLGGCVETGASCSTGASISLASTRQQGAFTLRESSMVVVPLALSDSSTKETKNPKYRLQSKVSHDSHRQPNPSDHGDKVNTRVAIAAEDDGANTSSFEASG